MSKRPRVKATGKSESQKTRPPLIIGLIVAAAVIIALGVVAAMRTNANGGVKDFSMVAYQGESTLGAQNLNFSSLFTKGQSKPVVLNFWGGTCPPCRAEMPGFQQVYDSLKDQFIMVGVDVGTYMDLGTHSDAQQLLQTLHITYPAAYATVDPISLYKIDGLPTTIMFTPNGKVLYEHVGYFPEDQFRTDLQNLISKSSAN